MKNAFPSYYRPDSEQLRSLWRDAIFIFDTNVLLDLHRYSKTTREEFLSVLRNMSERVWIPHQVGLEYQENRLTVIAEQEQRYEKAIQVLDTSIKTLEDGLSQLNLRKSHSPIDPMPTIEKVRATLQPFRDELDQLRQGQPRVLDEDTIRNQLDEIFAGRVGDGPASQTELDELYSIGKLRYARRIPPGYKDQKKAKSALDQQDTENAKDGFSYKGLFYQREFGDLIIWQQVIDYLARETHSQVVMITADNKEDWWWKVKGQVIGPRHELVEEVRLKTQIDIFYMYNAEQFLRFSRDYLAAQVSQESIDQVRDVMQQRLPNRYLEVFTKAHQITEHVYNRLRESFPQDDLVYQEQGFPDIIQTTQEVGLKRGHEIKLIRNFPHFRMSFRDLIDRAINAIDEGELDDATLVLVTEDEERLQKVRRLIEEKFRERPNVPIFVEFGIAHFDDNNDLLSVIYV